MEVVDELPTRPPESYATHKVNWDEVASTARDNPGKWVKVPVTLSTGMSGNFRNGLIRGMEPSEFEVRTTECGEGPHRRQFYFRWKGNDA